MANDIVKQETYDGLEGKTMIVVQTSKFAADFFNYRNERVTKVTLTFEEVRKLHKHLGGMLGALVIKDE